MSTCIEMESTVLSLAAERVTVEKHLVDKAIVTIRSHVDEKRFVVHEDTEHVSFNIERVPIDVQVEAAPAVRQDGDTTIYPIIEEELVVTKRLILREELRVTRVVTIIPVDKEITLRSVTADVIRTPVETAPVPPHGRPRAGGLNGQQNDHRTL